MMTSISDHMNVTIETKAKLAVSIKELIDPMTMRRRVGMVYYHQLENGGLIARTLTEQTDDKFVRQLVKQKRLYVPIETIIAETK